MGALGRYAISAPAVRAATPAGTVNSRHHTVERGLQEHQLELEAERQRILADLAAYREEHGGFTSMSRLGLALARPHHFWSTVTDAEAIHQAPQREQLRALEERAELCDRALARLDAGDPLLAASEQGVDFRLDELARFPLSSADGPVIEDPVARATERVALLEEAIAAREPERATELFRALVEEYLTTPATSGESMHRDAAGQPTVLALVNDLRGRGALPGGRPLTTSEELAELAPKLAHRLANLLPHPGARKKESRELWRTAIDAEVSRIQQLERDPELRGLWDAGASRACELFDEIEPHDLKWGLGQLGQGVLQLLDEPDLYAMVLMGWGMHAAAARLSALSKIPLMPAREVIWKGRLAAIEPAKNLAKLKSALGLYAAWTAFDASVFHSGMNLFQIARGKGERVSWDLGAFARTGLLFLATGGSRGLYETRAVPTSRLGRLLHSGRFLAEESAAMAAVGIGEARLRNGDFDGCAAYLKESVQFLIAMRMVSGAQRLMNGQSAQAVTRLRAVEDVFLEALGEAEGADPAERGAAFAKLLARYMDYVSTSVDVGRELQRRVFFVPPEQYDAAATELQERFNLPISITESGALSVPLVGVLAIRDEGPVENARRLRHELAHLVDPDAIVAVLEEHDLMPALRTAAKGELRDAKSFVKDDRALASEVAARWAAGEASAIAKIADQAFSAPASGSKKSNGARLGLALQKTSLNALVALYDGTATVRPANPLQPMPSADGEGGADEGELTDEQRAFCDERREEIPVGRPSTLSYREVIEWAREAGKKKLGCFDPDNLERQFVKPGTYRGLARKYGPPSSLGDREVPRQITEMSLPLDGTPAEQILTLYAMATQMTTWETMLELSACSPREKVVEGLSDYLGVRKSQAREYLQQGRWGRAGFADHPELVAYFSHCTEEAKAQFYDRLHTDKPFGFERQLVLRVAHELGLPEARAWNRLKQAHESLRQGMLRPIAKDTAGFVPSFRAKMVEDCLSHDRNTCVPMADSMDPAKLCPASTDSADDTLLPPAPSLGPKYDPPPGFGELTLPRDVVETGLSIGGRSAGQVLQLYAQAAQITAWEAMLELSTLPPRPEVVDALATFLKDVQPKEVYDYLRSGRWGRLGFGDHRELVEYLHRGDYDSILNFYRFLSGEIPKLPPNWPLLKSTAKAIGFSGRGYALYDTLQARCDQLRNEMTLPDESFEHPAPQVRPRITSTGHQHEYVVTYDPVPGAPSSVDPVPRLRAQARALDELGGRYVPTNPDPEAPAGDDRAAAPVADDTDGASAPADGASDDRVGVADDPPGLTDAQRDYCEKKRAENPLYQGLSDEKVYQRERVIAKARHGVDLDASAKELEAIAGVKPQSSIYDPPPNLDPLDVPADVAAMALPLGGLPGEEILQLYAQGTRATTWETMLELSTLPPRSELVEALAEYLGEEPSTVSDYLRLGRWGRPALGNHPELRAYFKHATPEMKQSFYERIEQGDHISLSWDDQLQACGEELGMSAEDYERELYDVSFDVRDNMLPPDPELEHPMSGDPFDPIVLVSDQTALADKDGLTFFGDTSSFVTTLEQSRKRKSGFTGPGAFAKKFLWELHEKDRLTPIDLATSLTWEREVIDDCTDWGVLRYRDDIPPEIAAQMTALKAVFDGCQSHVEESYPELKPRKLRPSELPGADLTAPAPQPPHEFRLALFNAIRRRLLSETQVNSQSNGRQLLSDPDSPSLLQMTELDDKLGQYRPVSVDADGPLSFEDVVKPAFDLASSDDGAGKDGIRGADAEVRATDDAADAEVRATDDEGAADSVDPATSRAVPSLGPQYDPPPDFGRLDVPEAAMEVGLPLGKLNPGQVLQLYAQAAQITTWEAMLELSTLPPRPEVVRAMGDYLPRIGPQPIQVYLQSGRWGRAGFGDHPELVEYLSHCDPDTRFNFYSSLSSSRDRVQFDRAALSRSVDALGLSHPSEVEKALRQTFDELRENMVIPDGSFEHPAPAVVPRIVRHEGSDGIRKPMISHDPAPEAPGDPAVRQAAIKEALERLGDRYVPVNPDVDPSDGADATADPAVGGDDPVGPTRSDDRPGSVDDAPKLTDDQRAYCAKKRIDNPLYQGLSDEKVYQREREIAKARYGVDLDDPERAPAAPSEGKLRPTLYDPPPELGPLQVPASVAALSMPLGGRSGEEILKLYAQGTRTTTWEAMLELSTLPPRPELVDALAEYLGEKPSTVREYLHRGRWGRPGLADHPELTLYLERCPEYKEELYESLDNDRSLSEAKRRSKKSRGKHLISYSYPVLERCAKELGQSQEDFIARMEASCLGICDNMRLPDRDVHHPLPTDPFDPLVLLSDRTTEGQPDGIRWEADTARFVSATGESEKGRLRSMRSNPMDALAYKEVQLQEKEHLTPDDLVACCQVARDRDKEVARLNSMHKGLSKRALGPQHKALDDVYGGWERYLESSYPELKPQKLGPDELAGVDLTAPAEQPPHEFRLALFNAIRGKLSGEHDLMHWREGEYRYFEDPHRPSLLQMTELDDKPGQYRPTSGDEGIKLRFEDVVKPAFDTSSPDDSVGKDKVRGADDSASKAKKAGGDEEIKTEDKGTPADKADDGLDLTADQRAYLARKRSENPRYKGLSDRYVLASEGILAKARYGVDITDPASDPPEVKVAPRAEAYDPPPGLGPHEVPESVATAALPLGRASGEEVLRLYAQATRATTWETMLELSSLPPRPELVEALATYLKVDAAEVSDYLRRGHWGRPAFGNHPELQAYLKECGDAGKRQFYRSLGAARLRVDKEAERRCAKALGVTQEAFHSELFAVFEDIIGNMTLPDDSFDHPLPTDPFDPLVLTSDYSVRRYPHGLVWPVETKRFFVTRNDADPAKEPLQHRRNELFSKPDLTPADVAEVCDVLRQLYLEDAKAEAKDDAELRQKEKHLQGVFGAWAETLSEGFPALKPRKLSAAELVGVDLTAPAEQPPEAFRWALLNAIRGRMAPALNEADTPDFDQRRANRERFSEDQSPSALQGRELVEERGAYLPIGDLPGLDPAGASGSEASPTPASGDTAPPPQVNGDADPAVPGTDAKKRSGAAAPAPESPPDEAPGSTGWVEEVTSVAEVVDGQAAKAGALDGKPEWFQELYLEALRLTDPADYPDFMEATDEHLAAVKRRIIASLGVDAGKAFDDMMKGRPKSGSVAELRTTGQQFLESRNVRATNLLPRGGGGG